MTVASTPPTRPSQEFNVVAVAESIAAMLDVSLLDVPVVLDAAAPMHVRGSARPRSIAVSVIEGRRGLADEEADDDDDDEDDDDWDDDEDDDDEDDDWDDDDWDDDEDDDWDEDDDDDDDDDWDDDDDDED